MIVELVGGLLSCFVESFGFIPADADAPVTGKDFFLGDEIPDSRAVGVLDEGVFTSRFQLIASLLLRVNIYSGKTFVNRQAKKNLPNMSRF